MTEAQTCQQTTLWFALHMQVAGRAALTEVLYHADIFDESCSYPPLLIVILQYLTFAFSMSLLYALIQNQYLGLCVTFYSVQNRFQVPLTSRQLVQTFRIRLFVPSLPSCSCLVRNSYKFFRPQKVYINLVCLKPQYKFNLLHFLIPSIVLLRGSMKLQVVLSLPILIYIVCVLLRFPNFQIRIRCEA